VLALSLAVAETYRRSKRHFVPLQHVGSFARTRSSRRRSANCGAQTTTADPARVYIIILMYKRTWTIAAVGYISSGFAALRGLAVRRHRPLRPCAVAVAESQQTSSVPLRDKRLRRLFRTRRTRYHNNIIIKKISSSDQ